MKVEPRAAVFAAVIGVGATSTIILLALTFPFEGFLVLLFPAFLGWVLIPFLGLWVWRRLRRDRDPE